MAEPACRYQAEALLVRCPVCTSADAETWYLPHRSHAYSIGVGEGSCGRQAGNSRRQWLSDVMHGESEVEQPAHNGDRLVGFIRIRRTSTFTHS